MTYHVVQEDGSKFGPATIEDLKKWLSEGRVGPASVVEDEQGVRTPLSELPDFARPSVPPPTAGMTPPVQDPRYSAPAAPSKTNWVVPVVVVCAALCCGFAILVALLFPVFSNARTAAKRAATIVNVRRLASATLMYAQDNDGRLPPVTTDAEAMKPYIATYVLDERAYKTLNPAGGEFLGNRNLAGVDTSKLDERAIVTTVLFYESKDWPNGRRAVAWLDGRVKMAQGFSPEQSVKGVPKKTKK